MKLAKRAYLISLILLAMALIVPAQKSDKDDRNTTSTVGVGGTPGGPTGLFTVYDGHTLRKGEFTLSLAINNYDRDPGDVDITTIPVNFQVGLHDRFELFFGTEAYRGVHVNAPRNLSGFYLPNSQFFLNGALRSPPAIVLAPSGPGNGPFEGAVVYRPTGMPFANYPFINANAGTYGLIPPFFSGPLFGFPANTNALLGAVRTSGAVDNFPGIGSPFGGILPGVVFSTRALVNAQNQPFGEGPLGFTVAPTYIADAPFINRTWGESAFNSADFGFKWRFNDPDEAIGYGLMGFYRWYWDKATDPAGFNQMQRGAGPGGNKGDIGAAIFADARLATWVNMSANVSYLYTSKAKGTFGGDDFIILDRPDELSGALALDFPVNEHFQPIVEWRTTRYVGGRTPNALERHPSDLVAGFRVYPRRWWGFGLAYRMNVNQQNRDSFSQDEQSARVVVNCQAGTTNCQPATLVTTFNGPPPGFQTSSNPHGYIAQFWIGKRDERKGEVLNQAPSVDAVDLSDTVITLPCPPGRKSASGACDDNRTVNVSTRASDPENDVLTYNYTVSGGRIVGTGANVQWDLSTAQPGTYTITTGVDDGCGVCGKTDTKTIRVEECTDCILPCSCPPAPTITGPSAATKPGDTMTFTANWSGDGTYNWTVSSGTIESGQGTSSIVVRTTEGMAGTTVTATVEVGGTDPACNCPTQASETGIVTDREIPILTDEFGAAPDDDVKARVDNFFIQLNANPAAQGYIINYGTPAEIRRRRAQIMKAINRPGSGHDLSRVTFVDGPDQGTGVRTKFYVVPAGAENPTP
jgi:hypothetical protein